MKKTFLIFLTLSASLLIFQGCSDKKGCTDSAANNYDSDADEDDETCTYTAGLGGNVNIVAKAQHHYSTMVSDSAYLDSAFIKFNTQNSPGTNPSAYDLFVVGIPGDSLFHINGLKRGKYFIFMTCRDSVELVTGGIPYEITQTSGTINLVVPVVE